jgi:molybdopterin converting factor subunit 1
VNVTVKLFAIVKERAGVGEVSLDMPAGATVAAAGRALVERFPALNEFEPRVAYAVNREYASRETVLRDGDELALIPPVSGGSR